MCLAIYGLFVCCNTDTSGVCSAHQINEIDCNDTVGYKVFEFQGTGPDGPANRADTFECSVPGTDIGPEDCKKLL